MEHTERFMGTAASSLASSPVRGEEVHRLFLVLLKENDRLLDVARSVRCGPSEVMTDEPRIEGLVRFEVDELDPRHGRDPRFCVDGYE